MERASDLASLISWIMEMGLEFPMVRSELNSPSVTNPGKGTIILDKEDGLTKRIRTVIKNNSNNNNNNNSNNNSSN